MRGASPRSRRAFRFVLLLGAVSLFADCTYEGSRSILGPFLATLRATGFVVGVVTGFGELVGYSLRLVSGRVADVTGRYWPITITGYIVQMASVPALAFAGSWPEAAALIVLERAGKAIRNPPRDVMLSYAGREMGGYGWVFGLHEGLDQLGAMFGPLAVAAVLAHRGSYPLAFGVLAVPATINLVLVFTARTLYPRPRDLDSVHPEVSPAGMPRAFWVYLVGAALVAAGFADYPILAFHLTRTGVAPGEAVAVFYAVAMAVSGAGSLVL
ncbi:MAG: MFS transporter, partial [Proteobacteria bacterium]|nr:MFS transporter [Pseudomonadota bacterium]